MREGFGVGFWKAIRKERGISSWFLLLLVFVFVGRTSHPSLSLVSFLLLIYFSLFLIKKKNKEGVGSCE